MLTNVEKRLMERLTDINSLFFVNLVSGVVYRKFKNKNKELTIQKGCIRMNIDKDTSRYPLMNVLKKLRVKHMYKLFKNVNTKENIFTFFKDGNISNLHIDNIIYCNMFEYMYYKYKDNEDFFNTYMKNRVCIIDKNYNAKECMLDGLIPFSKIKDSNWYIDALGFILKDSITYVKRYIDSSGHTYAAIKRIKKDAHYYRSINERIITILGNTFIKQTDINNVVTLAKGVEKSNTNLMYVNIVSRHNALSEYHKSYSKEFKNIMEEASMFKRKCVINNVEYESLTDAATAISKHDITTTSVRNITAFISMRLNDMFIGEVRYIYKKLELKRIG